MCRVTIIDPNIIEGGRYNCCVRLRNGGRSKRGGRRGGRRIGGIVLDVDGKKAGGMSW